MTPQERAEELDRWDGILEIDFAKFHQRIEELVGRPVLTHEMASSVWPYLRHEILTGERPGIEGVLAKLPAHLPVIPVLKEDDE